MPKVRVNDIQIYYETRGEGEPLVVIVGLGTDISEWENIIAPLSRHYHVIACDNRGAGRTDKPNIPYSIAMMAADTAGLLRALGIARSNVLGVSLGGRIALELALTHPEQVDRLMLVSTSARVAQRPWWFGLMSLLSTAPILRGKYPQPRYAFRRQRAASSNFDVTARLSEIAAPTLILHGQDDKTVPLALAEELHAGIAASRMLVFPGGHIFFFGRQRQTFLDAVVAFLSS